MRLPRRLMDPGIIQLSCVLCVPSLLGGQSLRSPLDDGRAASASGTAHQDFCPRNERKNTEREASKQKDRILRLLCNLLFKCVTEFLLVHVPTGFARQPLPGEATDRPPYPVQERRRLGRGGLRRRIRHSNRDRILPCDRVRFRRSQTRNVAGRQKFTLSGGLCAAFPRSSPPRAGSG